MNKIFYSGNARPKAPSLDPTFALSASVGNPHLQPAKFIHVAGTNGKGSVTIKTAKALASQGYKVGMFISPHIRDFRERIQIFEGDKQSMISKERVVQLAK